MRAPAPISAVARALPDGRSLPAADWAVRHRVMTLVLALHLPFIVGYGLLRDASVPHALVEVSAPAVLVVVAVLGRGRRIRALAVSLGLVTCSAIFVHLSDGLIEWHFHYFVMLALIALYQEWTVYLLALAFVVVQHAVGSWLAFSTVYNHGNGEWWWALVHGAFVLCASACHIASWRFNELATERGDRAEQELAASEESVVRRIEETSQMRSDLIATASHEFRTPLTVISGAAVTLQRHRKALSEAESDALLTNIITRADRLGLMLESMIIAAQMEPAEPTSTPLLTVVNEVLPKSASAQIVVGVPDYLWVCVGRRPLAQLLERLLDSARLKGDLGAPVEFTAEPGGGDVRLEVRVAATDIDEDAIAGIFDPFRGGTFIVPRSADVGLGLYAVRRIAEVHGGSASVSVDRGAFVVEVRLPRAPVDVPLPRPTSADIPAVMTPR
ncbi:MAG TPA: HAMP domain-containing sensor histidine kinase [Mycobacteriales bacterium]|nr:HAMP domain-containing sensor histidine kinase [Mycobacteriales bacterium]